MIMSKIHTKKWINSGECPHFPRPDLLLGLAQLDETAGQARLLVLPGCSAGWVTLQGLEDAGRGGCLQGKDAPLQHETVELDQLQETSAFPEKHWRHQRKGMVTVTRQFGHVDHEPFVYSHSFYWCINEI